VKAVIDTSVFVSYLFTWDKALLGMGTFENGRFIDPAAFVSILRATE
jgi:predicted nucleic acid-binding protein